MAKVAKEKEQQQQKEATPSLDTVDHRSLATKKSFEQEILPTQTYHIKEAFKLKITEIITQTVPPDNNSNNKNINNDNKIETHYYYPFELSEIKPYSGTITHFENVQNFFVQLVKWFLPFDEFYEKFQKDCEESKLYISRKLLG